MHSKECAFKVSLGSSRLNLKLRKNSTRRKCTHDVTVSAQAETDGTPKTEEYSHSVTYDHPTYNQPKFQPITKKLCVLHIQSNTTIFHLVVQWVYNYTGCNYEMCSIIYLPKQERRQWADWNKSVHVGTCLEVSHMQPHLSAILTVRVTACQVNLCVRFLRNCSIWSKDQL